MKCKQMFRRGVYAGIVRPSSETHYDPTKSFSYRGLGKTIQCIALIAHLITRDVSGPFLVVAPLATLPNWVREFERWLPQVPVIRYHGTSPERDAMWKGPLDPKKKRSADFPFIVTSYEMAIRDRSKLERLGEFTFLIVDEGHRLKNHRCTLLGSLKRLKAANRLLLSGTPIQNRYALYGLVFGVWL